MSGRREGEWYSQRLARVSAEFASRGFLLHHLDGSKLIVTRWGMTRVLNDLDEAEQMLARLGVTA